MKRFFIYIIVIVSILVVSLASSEKFFYTFKNTDTIINKIGCRLFEFNTINVETDNELDLKKVVIKIGNNTVYKNKQQHNKIGQYYGHVILKIYYENQLISEIGHWKRNNWYTNNYNIKIMKKTADYSIAYDINGPDGKHDNFQKRYIYASNKKLIRIDYQNENGKVYHTEKP